jgi:hypothetical protein
MAVDSNCNRNVVHIKPSSPLTFWELLDFWNLSIIRNSKYQKTPFRS